MTCFHQALTSFTRLLFDGAMGTMLQSRGLKPGENPEVFCLANPDILQGIHKEYIKAGADVLTTGSFGGTRFKLQAGTSIREFNRLMAGAARAAAADAGRPVFVAGSIGPTGKFLRPLGELSFEEMVTAFQEQIRGLLEGGIDLVLAETQFDIAEARAIVLAARRECGLPVAVSMTYEAGVTLTGSDVAVCTATLANMGVDLIGMNCSAGPVEMRAAVAELLLSSPVPVLVEPNAGLPSLENGHTVFPLSPAEFAVLTSAFAGDGVQVVGGCCGTTPEHIAALRRELEALPALGPRPVFSGVALTSRSQVVRIGAGQALRIIGERINPTGKKRLNAELPMGEFGEALRLADEQIAHGAHILDVNVGAPMVDEGLRLPELVSRLVSRCSLPLALDSSDMGAVEKALPEYPASPLVNSVNGEAGRMEYLGSLCRDYGAPFILLPLRGKELPVKAAERIAIVEDMLRQMEDLRIPRFLALVDALALAVSSSPGAAGECLECIRYCTTILKLPTVCGLSNISFGLPAREMVNAGFLSMAAAVGLSACIANPGSARIAETVKTADLLLGHDEGAAIFISEYSGWKDSGAAGGEGRPPSGSGQHPGDGVLPSGKDRMIGPQSIEEALIAGREEDTLHWVRVALEEGADPFLLVGERLIPAITDVGARYERKEYFLPQLIRSAEAMQAAFAMLRPLLAEDSRDLSHPVVVLATVEGDIHDIGKNIVSLMLGNHGFKVVDLGKDVSAADVVEAAVSHNAELIGLSALMTTTMVRMRDTVDLLQRRKIDKKVMVGGAVVTEDFARSIGAHYARDAVDAVRLARQLTTKPM
ncbi:MAG: homocysteine S-methyltransferase family protein [Desulfovibrio sp.]|jgi:5-methyltetrahydrofolate--homocysteine methyltransferase|nr:homocysteine S-methyltransferase family protein [Desulfovibrio sp.]